MMIRFIVTTVLCMILAHVEETDTHSCNHVAPAPQEVVHGVPLEAHVPHHMIRKRSINQHLRIHLDYDSSVAALPTDKQNLVRTDLILEAVAYWETTLQVRNTTGPIRLLRQCNTDRIRYKDGDPYPYCVDGCKSQTKCGESIVPENHLEACRVAPVRDTFHVQGYGGAGAKDSDFILYISAHQTERCSVGTTVAYAAYCQLESALDRPVAGYVNLCPNSISTKGHDLHQMHSTIKHEILHALGFSAGLYAFYRDSQGEPLTPRLRSTGKPIFNQTSQLYQWSDHVIRTVTRDKWNTRSGFIKKAVHMIVTPKVVEHVRKHFGCPTLEGAELEDQGVIGTAITHWEKRVFENEVMTGTYTQNPLISDITLALMEDTGWYKVDYSKAQKLEWGRGLGCDFVMKSCRDWIIEKRKSKQHIHPYCDRPKQGLLETECTESREAVALCNLVEHKAALPPQFQYFNELPGVPEEALSRYGGTVVLADYCPYIQEFNWRKGNNVVRGSRCNIKQTFEGNDINYMLESFGSDSKCFNHAKPWVLRRCEEDKDLNHWGSGCYKYKCTEEAGLIIVAGDKEYRCYQEDQVIDISALSDMWLHLGTIVCPPCAEICEAEGIECPLEMTPPQRSFIVNPISPCTGSSRRANIYYYCIIALPALLLKIGP